MKFNILVFCYSCISFFLSLILGPLFCFKARGRARLWERYGLWGLKGKAGEPYIWFHGASMGEMNGLLPIIKATKRDYPDSKILVTATSVTAFEKVKGVADEVRLLPFDHIIWISKALSYLEIDKLIVCETELWPGVLSYLNSRNTPVYLVNARISDYSINNYLYLRSFFGPLLSELKAICAINDVSVKRFIELGAESGKVSNTGHAKYDLKPSISNKEKSLKLKAQVFGNEFPVITLGSIRPGEEEFWFPALAEAKEKGCEFNLVIAPRHKEKVEFFKKQMDVYSIKFLSWQDRIEGASDYSSEQSIKVLFLDVMGKLESMYSFSDLSFIGASLIEGIGGHNPLEAAAYASMVTMGRNYSTVYDIVELLKVSGGVEIIENQNEIEDLIELVCDRREVAEERGQKAQDVWKQLSGATERIMDKVFAGEQDVSA